MKIKSLRCFMGLIIALVIAAPALPSPSLSGYFSDSEAEAIILRKQYNARRDGHKLILKTKGGEKVFKNEGPNTYFLAGYDQFSPGQSFLVYSTGEGGPSYYLINVKSGEEVQLVSLPNYSPGRKRFCVMHFDGDAGLNPSLIRIYEYDGNGFKSEWEKAYNNFAGPTDPVWADDDTLVYFENKCSGENGACTKYVKAPVKVEKRDGKWVGPRELK